MATRPDPKDQPQSDPREQQRVITERGPGVKVEAPGTGTKRAPVTNDAEHGPKPVSDGAQPKKP